MLKQFDTARDASMRLNEIIMFYDGEPSVCKVHDGDLRGPDVTVVSVIPLKNYGRNAVWKRVNYTDPKFVVGFPELGYVNTKNGVVYASTTPTRSQKWGLTDIKGSIFGSSMGHMPSSALYSKYMSQALLGDYPTFKVAFDTLRTNARSSCAFDIDYALAQEDKLCVLYTDDNKRLGVVNQDGKIVLDDSPSKEYTKKQLQQVLDVKGGSFADPV